MHRDGHRIALVTGANQGLGFALVEGLLRDPGPGGVVYLTARNEERIAAAVATLQERGLSPRFARMDVSEPESITSFAEAIRAEHGGVDIVLSNAAQRIVRDIPPQDQVRRFICTNNLGTTLMLESFGPLLRDGGRFLVVASGFGRLHYLSPPLAARFNEASSLRAVDDIMLAYVDAVERGRAAEEGWPEWINIPSKVGQVASMRVYAQAMASEAERRGLVIDAVCPGLVDTEASRPWFEDMSKAQTPNIAAQDLLWLAMASRGELPYGELVQHRKVLPWHA